MSQNPEQLTDSDSNIAPVDSEFSIDSECETHEVFKHTDSENGEERIVSQKSVQECINAIHQLEITCAEFESKCKQQQISLDLVSKQYASAVREKELMVMRYAVSEKTVLELKSCLENAEKKQKEALRENEILQHKVSGMASEKSRICQILDNKVYDMKCNQQELEKVKLDLNAIETKLKWSHNALKVEKDLRKESDTKVEGLRLTLQEYVNEIDHVKREAQDSIKTYQTSQENRAYVLEQQLQEQQATLILLRHEKDDKDKQVKLLQFELEKLQLKEKGTLHENSTTLAKLHLLGKENLELKQSLGELWESENKLKHTETELEELKLKLNSEVNGMDESSKQIKTLNVHNSDLETDLKACRERNCELLLFTQKLTDKNVQLQSEFTALETKIEQLTCEQDLLRRSAMECESEVGLLRNQLVNDRYKYAAENSDLAKKLQTKELLCEALSQDVSDQQGENCIIKRKLELSLKEVTKELQLCRKKIDQYETASQSSNSSSSSLNAVDPPNNLSTSYADGDGDQVKVIQPVLTLEKQALVEHIVKLQRVSARKSEKIDFLEEHINTLVAELQRKTHLLQSYIIREQTGAMTSNKMDKNKANIAKLHGVMASVYGSRVADNSLTLELSLDINHKLQAVLEDALLKNITLKESVDTLGAEIDRLNNLLKSSYTNTINT